MKKAFIFTLVLLLCLSLLALTAFASTPTKLKLKRNRVITYGDKFNQEGYFWSGSSRYVPANGINDEDIILMRRVRGRNRNWNKSWVLETITKNGNKGYFSKESQPRYNTQYRAYFPGDSTFARTVSHIVTTYVRVKINLSGRKTSKGFKISGIVRPLKARRRVLVKLKPRGRGWRTIRLLRLNRNSRFRYLFRFRRRNGRKIKKGTYYLRVFYRGDRYNRRNVSRTLSFTVN